MSLAITPPSGYRVWRAAATFAAVVFALAAPWTIAGSQTALGLALLVVLGGILSRLRSYPAPPWTFAAIVETNNKVDGQRGSTEEEGPFPAAQISYVTDQGSLFTLWAGKRLGGYLCAGGVCKFEPAFEGVELFGTIRY